MSKKEIISSITPILAPNSLAVAKKRYMKINEKGEVVETPAEMFYRVSEFMASADKVWDKNADLKASTKEFYDMMANAEFYPAGRILFEAGNNHTGQMSSCFVLPIDDSLEGVFNTLKAAAITQQNNGGTGFNFSKIRPKGDSVKGHPGVAAGPIHFLRTFDAALSRVLQGSKRHGGNMGILNIDHPDIEEFIKLKDNGSDVKNFNISVGVTRNFMEKLRADQDYELINPHTKKAVKKLRAKDIFEQIVNRAWQCADPGMIFLDAVQDANVNDHLGVMDATNPCGEQPLLPNESCNLGSILLQHFALNGDVDWAKLKKTTYSAVHFLDNLIELNKYPLPEIDAMVKKTRKIGLGVMGYAHLLFKLGIPYNSQAAIDLIQKIMEFVNANAIEASKELSKVRGVFPAWKGSKWEKRGVEIRNSHVTSIQPTGTVSMLANTSSGIEPVFSLVTIRRTFFEDQGNKTGGSVMKVVDPAFEELAREKGFYSEALLEKIADGVPVSQLDEIPADLKKVFVTTHDISYDWHVKIQAAAQTHVDAAVSKTINMTREATVDDVRKAYIMAYQLGCKGVTIYRDGSKEAQVLNTSSGHKAAAKAEDKVISPFVPEAKSQVVQAETGVGVGNAKALITPNALTVLEKRALKKDANGKVVETPEQLFRRVARFVASAEKKYEIPEARVKEVEEKFYNMVSGLEFISGQALRNSETDLTLSACLVLPITDSIEGIMTAIAENTAAHKATCGTGINYSRLRPKGSLVGSVGGVAAGPVSFMRALSVVQKTIQTKGGRGQGSMGILNVDHPD
ncbi:adenosylcobalamin-dependent ribonucleoside-diphosphate reductase, partial [Candidatus Uhrbacteria bacterium]|nr:adenosylcobalamin-dependent ribonucleoside-diphosphate reductase [Candidatus Uhrbacteria bacterium]